MTDGMRMLISVVILSIAFAGVSMNQRIRRLESKVQQLQQAVVHLYPLATGHPKEEP